jgi:hypothetical protein
VGGGGGDIFKFYDITAGHATGEGRCKEYKKPGGKIS